MIAHFLRYCAKICHFDTEHLFLVLPLLQKTPVSPVVSVRVPRCPWTDKSTNFHFYLFLCFPRKRRLLLSLDNLAFFKSQCLSLASRRARGGEETAITAFRLFFLCTYIFLSLSFMIVENWMFARPSKWEMCRHYQENKLGSDSQLWLISTGYSRNFQGPTPGLLNQNPRVCLTSLTQWCSTGGWWSPQGTSGSIWRQFWLS